MIFLAISDFLSINWTQLVPLLLHTHTLEAENDDAKMCFGINEGQIVLDETSYCEVVCSLKLVDKPPILTSLLDYHLMIKVKAQMDQFKKGLPALGLYVNA